MKTTGYVLIILGAVMMMFGIRGHKIESLPKDLAQASVALATGNMEEFYEVLNRTEDKATIEAPFETAANIIASRSGIAVGAAAGKLGSDVVGSGGKKSVGDLVALGKSLRAKGFTVAENKALGDNPRPGVHMAKGMHYKFDNSGAIDVNWPDKSKEPEVMDKLAPILRSQGFHVLWRVKGHYNHLHADIS